MFDCYNHCRCDTLLLRLDLSEPRGVLQQRDLIGTLQSLTSQYHKTLQPQPQYLRLAHGTCFTLWKREGFSSGKELLILKKPLHIPRLYIQSEIENPLVRIGKNFTSIAFWGVKAFSTACS